MVKLIVELSLRIEKINTIKEVMKLINQIISNPVYLLLFGSGGVLSIIVAALTIFTKKRKNKGNGKLQIENNYKTKIEGNKIHGRIRIKDNKSSTIVNNEFTDD